MEGPYYLAMLIGVIWLCLWIGFPKLTSRYPSPFDMRDDTEQFDSGPEGRRRGKPAREAEAEPAHLQHPVPQPRPAQSWRVRREQAEASGRKRRG
ncbi:hypothetical protein [Roseomonas sp. AR75]|uniref:hypothetical protein n=1 Tax=Roseomonas sp. AR75 TaxID=2562311 RepID=UPI001F10723B|nr:hypothetical protein [Roseomonas sp. AR75]